MFSIIASNFGFWFNFSLPVIFALFLAFTHREYIFKEFFIQTIVTLAYVCGVYFLLFSSTANLVDTEYWNGAVTRFEYYEEWTEKVEYTEKKCTGSGEKRKCKTVIKTRKDYHSPEWKLYTTNGETISINSSYYRTASNEFGQNKKDLYRSGQVSIGDGDMYYSIPKEIIPTAVDHNFTNYVTAANHNVIHTKVSQPEIDELVKSGKLKPYPTRYRGKYGETKLKRIIDTVGISNNNLLDKLDLIASNLGASKQANPIIYITDMDRTFTAALEYYWNKSKKNDIVLVLNVDKKTGIVEWSDVICWTNNTDFIVDAQNVFKGKKFDESLIKNFGNLIVKGYVRKPMAEFEYLRENITLVWQWQLVIFLGNVVISFFVFRYMLTNSERKGRFHGRNTLQGR